MARSKFTTVAALFCSLSLAAAYPAQVAEPVDYCVPVQPPCQQCQPVPPPCQAGGSCSPQPVVDVSPGIDIDVDVLPRPGRKPKHHRHKETCENSELVKILKKLPPVELGFCSELYLTPSSPSSFAIPAIPTTPPSSLSVLAIPAVPSAPSATDASVVTVTSTVPFVRETQTELAAPSVQLSTVTTTTTTVVTTTSTNSLTVTEFPFSAFDISKRETEKVDAAIPDEVIADAIAEQVGKIDPESFIKQASVPKNIKAAFDPRNYDHKELVFACNCFFPPITTTVSVASIRTSVVLLAASSVAPEIFRVSGPNIINTITETATVTQTATATVTNTATSTLTELTLL